MPYDDYELAYAAPAIRNTNGESWAAAHGLLCDMVVEGAANAIMARWLTVCPNDALTHIGIERGIPQRRNEGLNDYRTRMLDAWTTWTYMGTKTGVLSAVQALGYTNVALEENADGTMPPSPGFSAGDEWWRFRLIIGLPNSFSSSWTIGDGTTIGRTAANTIPGATSGVGTGGVATTTAGRTVGVGGTGQAIGDIVTEIRRTKPPHAVCVSVIVMLSGKAVGGGWNVGDGTLVGGVALTFGI